MKRWVLQKDVPIAGVQAFADLCFGEDDAFQRQFHHVRGDTEVSVGAWEHVATDRPRGALPPPSRPRSATPSQARPLHVRTESQHRRQISSRAPFKAPVVVQRMLGDVSTATVQVIQLRTVEESAGLPTHTLPPPPRRPR